MKAWAITVDGFDAMVACGTSRGKAVAATWRSAQAAGYTSVTWAKIKATRWAAMDGWARRQLTAIVQSVAMAEEDNRRHERNAMTVSAYRLSGHA